MSTCAILPVAVSRDALRRCVEIMLTGATFAYKTNADFIVPAADCATLRDALRYMRAVLLDHDPEMDAGYPERLENTLRSLGDGLDKLRKEIDGCGTAAVDNELTYMRMLVDGMQLDVSTALTH